MQYKYTSKEELGGISKEKREILDLINREFNIPFSIQDVLNISDMQYKKVARLLAHFASHGWLNRIKKGLYITVPLGSASPRGNVEDPWIVANKIFEPCYIGGWSACEYWGLTEQIFETIIVFTSKKLRKNNMKVQQTNFILKPTTKEKLFGIKPVWREQVKVLISNPTRTIIDILNNPFLGGGIKHVIEIIITYFNDEKYLDVENLLEYSEKLGNRAVYKRLGFLVDMLELNYPDILKVCKQNMSIGYSLLDPSVPHKGHIVKYWNLKINVDIKKGDFIL